MAEPWIRVHANLCDSDRIAANALKEEGAFLFAAERGAEALERHLEPDELNAHHITIPRAELERIAQQFTRVVAIAKEYHIGAAEIV